MSANDNTKSSKRDTLLWVLIVILLAAGIGANYYYLQIAWSLRVAIGIVFVSILAVIALQTQQGKAAFAFAKEARAELRRVVWPSRQETIQTTVLIVALVVVMALVLWGIDSLLLWAASWLAGQRG
ncbi:MAG: preprotein translocase subunit SecE [Gammaproteobacteria bacterium]